MKKVAILIAFVGLCPILFSQELIERDSLTDSDKLFEPIKIFPNPTSEILFIRNGELIDSYELFNLQGEVLQKGKSETQIISLIDVPIGHYFLFIEIDGYYKNYRVSKF